MNIVFQKEKLDSFYDELLPLIQAHWKEVCSDGEMDINLNYEAYKQAEEMGSWMAFTARLNSGTLVGYASFKFETLLHSKHSTIAMNDTLFLHPMVRKGLTGYRFFKYTVNEVKKLIVNNAPLKYVGLTSHTGHELNTIAKRMGFKPLYTLSYMEV